MAQLLGESPDEWIVLAGRVPDDVLEIIQGRAETIDLLRAVRGLTAEQIRRLIVIAKR